MSTTLDAETCASRSGVTSRQCPARRRDARTSVNINNKGYDSDSLCHLVQWSMTSIPVSDYLSSIPITSPLSFQYHSSHYAYPLLLLYHCDCCLSTPMRVPIAHHPHSCALPRHPRYPERPVGAFRCLSLSVMSLWRKRLLLDDHFETNNTTGWCEWSLS